jgi:ABC-type transport system involved in multi-copper enzyme maturation permease subunit
VIQRVTAVALNTFRETVRDRIFYLVAIFGLILLASSALLSPLTIGAQGKIVADVGLASLSLFGLLVVVFVGSGMLRKELDKRTITTILTKPVSRLEYLLGKYAGLTLTLFCMLAAMVLLFMLVTLVTPATFSARYLAAIYLVFWELLLINGAVLLYSTFVSPVLAMVFTLGLFVIGHLSEDILSFGQLMGGTMQAAVSRAIYYLVPNLEIFNARGLVVHGGSVSAAHLGLATLYGFCYTALLIVLAAGIFARRELK